MTPEAAAWVREHVWTDAHRRIDAASPAFYGMCSCQYGICGACDGSSDQGRARHDMCISRTGQFRPITVPITWLTDSRCMVVGPALWPAAGACRYTCPCPCTKTDAAQSPPRRRPDTHRDTVRPTAEHDDSAQLGLFAEAPS